MAPKNKQKTLRIGTRSSRLALAQSHWVGARVESRCGGDIRADFVLISTKGDKLRHLSLAKLDDKGFFTREIEAALLSNEIDVAVHSYKDMPTQGPEGLEVAALPWREDPADLLLIRPEAHEPDAEGFPIKSDALVGTGSVRRQVQLLEKRPDLKVADLRGNINTRLEKLLEGRFDAIILAAAGVARIGLDLKDCVVHRLDPKTFTPAPAQGVVAVQMRADDRETGTILERIHAPEIGYLVSVERRFLALAEGGCNLPLGAWAEVMDDGQIRLHSFVGQKGWAPGDPVDIERVTVVGEEPETLAWTAIQIYKDRRGGKIWSDAAVQSVPEGGNRVLVTASASVGKGQMRALKSAGFGVVHVPMIETESIVTLDVLQEVAGGLRDGDWLVFASGAAVRHFLERFSRSMLPVDLKVAAVGLHTAERVRSFGFDVHFVPTKANSPGFISDFLPIASSKENCRFVLPVALEGRRDIANFLRSQGRDVKVVPVYRTKPAEGEAVEVALSIDYDVVIFSSPSGVRTYAGIKGAMPPRSIAIGPTTQACLEDAGATNISLAEDPSPEAIVRLLQGFDSQPSAGV